MPSLPDIRTMLRQLVAVPSVSSIHPGLDCSNAPVVELLAEWLSDLGFDVHTQALKADPGKFNLIASLGGPAGDGLVLSGHTDTVPYDEEGWKSDPFSLTERNQRLYGLGSSDMKSFFPLAIQALIRVQPKRLRRPLIMVATADEESSMQGARELESLAAQARYAVIGEPTGLKPVYMHKGVMMERVCIEGRSGHSSNPSLGSSALEGMHAVLGALLEWRAQLQARYRNEAFHVAVPTLNLGHIHGGDNANRICAQCELQLDLRPLPGMEPDEIRAQLSELVQNVLRDFDLKAVHDSIFAGVPPMATPRDSPIVQAVERISGQSAGTVAFGTEGPFYNAMGLETVVWGPGDIDCAHQPNEFMPCDRMEPYVAMLAGLIEEMCVQQPG